tara:strand:+ start:621 stop:2153 length:1533 start_codon:yes stop_codon:yes gene_type:complete
MSVRPNAVIRADADPAIGGGHVIRCLSLAAELSDLGWDLSLAMTEGGIPADGMEKAAICRRIPLPTERARHPETLIERAGGSCRLAIIDHYGLDAAYERELRDWASRIMVIDDLVDRPHDCDFLLDPSYGRTAADYAGLVPPSCRVLLGPAYALLRPAFARRRQASLARRRRNTDVHRLFVSFGLSDPSNMTSRALEGIAAADLENVTVDVVLGPQARHLAEVQACIAEGKSNVRVHINPSNLADLMAAADIALGAGGGTTWERCCLGVPTVAIPCAENQNANLSNLASTGAATTLSPESTSADISKALTRLAGSATVRREMSDKAALLCDGLGARRAGLAVQPEPAESANITLRPVTAADTKRVFDWQTEPGARDFSRNTQPPTPEGHEAWMGARLNQPEGIFEIIECDGEPAGFVRLDPYGEEKGSGGPDQGGAVDLEVSILVGRDHQGIGTGQAALRALRRLEPDARLHAAIREDHATSLRIFENCGYQRAGETFVNLPGPERGALH